MDSIREAYETKLASRLTIVSCEAKKKQAICDEQVNYLQVASTGLKFVNALNKPP